MTLNPFNLLIHLIKILNLEKSFQAVQIKVNKSSN